MASILVRPPPARVARRRLARCDPLQANAPQEDRNGQVEAQARATSRDAARGDGHRRGRRADRIQHLGVPDALRAGQRAVLRRALASLRMVGVRAAINGWTEFAKEHRRVWAVLRRAGGALMHVSVRRAFNGWIARAEEKHQTRGTMLWAATALSSLDVRRCMNHWVARVQAAHAELLSTQAWHRSYEEVWHAQPVEAEERTFKETLSYWQAAAERRSRDEWHARRVRTGDCLAEHTKSDTLFTAGGGEGHEECDYALLTLDWSRQGRPARPCRGRALRHMRRRHGRERRCWRHHLPMVAQGGPDERELRGLALAPPCERDLPQG